MCRSSSSSSSSWELPVFVPAACANAGANQLGVSWTRPENRVRASTRGPRCSQPLPTDSVANFKKQIIIIVIIIIIIIISFRGGSNVHVTRFFFRFVNPGEHNFLLLRRSIQDGEIQSRLAQKRSSRESKREASVS